MHKLTGMYDTKDINRGLTQAEERELKKYVDSGNLLKQNKDIFAQSEKNFRTCLRYNPCPICNKCLNKASHLYIKCQNCKIPICVHKHRDRVNLIKRENFAAKVDKETIMRLRELSKKVLGNENNG